MSEDGYFTDKDDPFEDLFTQDKNKETIENNRHFLTPDGKIRMLNMNVIQESGISQEETLYSEGFKYDYGYTISLNYPNEDGLMDTYLTESNIEIDKPRVNPSDWFNFGLDEEKWIKFLNKSILMHYERHLIQQTSTNELNKPTPFTMQQPVRPIVPMPMPNYPQYPYGMYRPGFMPFPGYPFPNPAIQGVPHQFPSQEDRNK